MKLLGIITSPEGMLRYLSIAAVVGAFCLFIGARLKSNVLVTAGSILGAPLLLGGILAIVIGLPYALWTRAKEARRNPRPRQ